MTADIINFPINKALRDNLSPSQCLDQAKLLNLTDVVIMGYTPEGKFFFSASEDVSNESTLFLLKCGEKYIFDEL